MSMSELVSRLESSLGLDRALDAAIAAFICCIKDLGGAVPRYTSNADDALSLVPDDGLGLVRQLWGEDQRHRAWEASVQVYSPPPRTWSGVFSGLHRHMAVAVCIACLKARAKPAEVSEDAR